MRMLFGLKNAPAMFQRALDMILRRYRWKTCLIYIGDIIIDSPTPEKHFKDMDQVLYVLRRSRVSIYFNECFFFKGDVWFLRNIIKPNRLEIDQAHVETLKQEKCWNNCHICDHSWDLWMSTIVLFHRSLKQRERSSTSSDDRRRMWSCLN